MRFSLQDVKKHVQKRGGELTVSLHFLRPGEMRSEIARLIDYHEQLLGQPQRLFSDDEARALVGDYRMAHCLAATLSRWYNRRASDWDEVLQGIGNTGLSEAGITSPIQLRLALYDYVNEHHAGFLDAGMRQEVLERFAALYHLTAHDLEYLLALDSDEEALLVREGNPPTPDEVAAFYNSGVFEAALFNASKVHFVIDCNAFLRSQQTPDQPSAQTAGVGAVIKRLCYLARKLGVYYDLAYESAGNSPTLLHLTLYGPQEMTGAPQQYGLRLARLCRMLLGYGVQGNRNLPLAAITQAEATIHFLQRSYRFVMDAALLKLLPGTKFMDQDAMNRVPTNAIFDSSIEQSFAEAFSALAQSSGADGWQLEREPEPILLPSSSGEASSQGIFIPDFALTRDQHRIYLEILGFWTPSYRERKLQKLQQLASRSDILLAIPGEAKAAFASIASNFPIVEYEGQLSATELLKTLRNHIDDFADRLARIDSEEVRRRVMQEGWLPERTCFEVLHCYRRSELAQAAERVTGETIAFTPGVGLYDKLWLEHLGVSFVEWLEESGGHALPLTEALRDIRMRLPALAEGEDANVEGLMSLWPSIHIRRNSIFEAVVELAGSSEEGDEDQGVYQESIPKKTVRERRAAYKKRPAGPINLTPAPATQQDLWG